MDIMKNAIKKTLTKTLKGRMEHKEHVPHHSTPNPIPTLYMHNGKEKKERNINPERKPKRVPLPQHQTKDTHTLGCRLFQ
jgi:hypothetical protein